MDPYPGSARGHRNDLLGEPQPPIFWPIIVCRTMRACKSLKLVEHAPDHAGAPVFLDTSIDVGAQVRMNRALNCWPWVWSLIHSPDAVTHSPEEMVAACAVTPRLDPKNAEAVVVIMESNTKSQQL